MRDRAGGGLLLVVALVVWCTPTSTGSATLDTGIAIVRVENALGNSCDPAIGSACVADVDGSPTDPGSMIIHTRQQIRYVGIATNVSSFPLLGEVPDQNVTLRGRDLALEHGVIRGAHETYRGTLPNPPLNGTAGLVLGPDNFTAYYVGPAPYDPTGPATYYEPGYTYDEKEAGWIGYEHLGPFNANIHAHTDLEWDNLPGWCAFLSDVPDCTLVLDALASLGKSSTPDVYYGFEWEDVQVATDPEFLSDPGASERRPTASALLLSRNATGTHGPPRRAPVDAQGPSEQGPYVPGPMLIPPTAPLGPEPPGSSSRLQATAMTDAESVPLLLLAATATATILLALAALFYSRFSRPEQLLKNENRKAILELLGACPGLNPTEIASRLGLARNAVIHHLNMLERSGAIVILPTDGRSTTVFLRSAEMPHPRMAAVLYHPIRGRFVHALREAPAGLSREEFHQRLHDIPARTRNHTLQSLIASRVMEATTGTDGSIRFRLAPEFASA